MRRSILHSLLPRRTVRCYPPSTKAQPPLVRRVMLAASVARNRQFIRTTTLTVAAAEQMAKRKITLTLLCRKQYRYKKLAYRFLKARRLQ